MRLYIALLFTFIQLNAQSGIISGFISDSSSAEALIGANVILQETGQGMATDINGYYIKMIYLLNQYNHYLLIL